MEIIEIIKTSFKLYLDDHNAFTDLKEQLSLSQAFILFNFILFIQDLLNFFFKQYSFMPIKKEVFSILLFLGTNLFFLIYIFYSWLLFRFFKSEVDFKTTYKIGLILSFPIMIYILCTNIISFFLKNYLSQLSGFTFFLLIILGFITIYLNLWCLVIILKTFAKLTKLSLTKVFVVTFLIPTVLFLIIFFSSIFFIYSYFK